MQEAFRLGGWGMYPTLFFGLVLLFAAAHYARRPDRRSLHIVRCLAVVTMLSSTLGFVTGVINTCLHAESARAYDVGAVVVVGVGESLTNIGLGLVLLIMASIAVTVGALRAVKPGNGKSELIDPTA